MEDKMQSLELFSSLPLSTLVDGGSIRLQFGIVAKTRFFIFLSLPLLFKIVRFPLSASLSSFLWLLSRRARVSS